MLCESLKKKAVLVFSVSIGNRLEIDLARIIIIIIITRQLQSQVTVRELTSIETREKVGLAIGWIDIQGFARPVI